MGGEGEVKVTNITYTDIYFKHNILLQVENNALISLRAKNKGYFCARMFRRETTCTSRKATKILQILNA